jgi:hypothetical protein
MSRQPFLCGQISGYTARAVHKAASLQSLQSWSLSLESALALVVTRGHGRRGISKPLLSNDLWIQWSWVNSCLSSFLYMASHTFKLDLWHIDINPSHPPSPPPHIDNFVPAHKIIVQLMHLYMQVPGRQRASALLRPNHQLAPTVKMARQYPGLSLISHYSAGIIWTPHKCIQNQQAWDTLFPDNTHCTTARKHSECHKAYMFIHR